MCLAVPMKVIAVQGEMARVDIQGVEAQVALDLVEDVAPGDYVLVHAGFAIQKVAKEEAVETLAILERLAQ